MPDAERGQRPEAQSSGVADILRGEYGTLLTALTATWQVSMNRTTLLLGVGSAFSVAIGLAAQATAFGAGFFIFALVLLPVLLFLGLATYMRVVQAARESVVYTLGMNRIRGFFARQVPDAAEYLVLPTSDDAASMYQSPGSGMSGRPRVRLVYALVQLPGVVTVVNAVVAGAITALVLTLLGLSVATVVAVALIVGLAMVGVLLAYWQRSMSQMLARMGETAQMSSPSADVDPPITDQ